MNLYFDVEISVDDATGADQAVTLDQIETAITLALKPFFSQVPCVNVNSQ